MNAPRSLFTLGRPTARPAAGAALALLLLAACSSGPPPSAPPCPLAVAPKDSAKIVRFNGQGRDLTDVEYEAEVLNLGVACVYKGNILETTVTVRIAAAQGPANRDGKADLVYFVAILTPDGRVVKRDAFDVTIPFSGNQTRVATEDEVVPRIPLAPDENGNDYVIWIGFEMSRSELDYNRANR